MTSQASERRPGRPRSADADRAIVRAAVDLIGERGLSGLTVDAVATRAGVGKATIYRRWPSKGDLVIGTLAAALEHSPVPDRGGLRADLLALAETMAAWLREPRVEGLLPAVVAEASRSPEVRASLGALVDDRRETARAVLRRAQRRGELRRGVDVEAVLDLLAGALHFRTMVSREPLGPEIPGRLVDTLLEGIVRR